MVRFSSLDTAIRRTTRAVNIDPTRVTGALSFENSKSRTVLIITTNSTGISGGGFQGAFNLGTQVLSTRRILRRANRTMNKIYPFKLGGGLSMCLSRSVGEFRALFPTYKDDGSTVRLAPTRVGACSSTGT